MPTRRLAYFNPDDPRYRVLVDRYAKTGFQVFTACHPCLHVFRRIYGRDGVWLLPFASNPLSQFSCAIRVPIAVFVGSVYPERLRIVRALLQHRYPLIVAGPGWRYFIANTAPGAYGLHYLALNRLAYISLNIHVKDDIGVKANMRVFEIPGAGGVELTDNPRIVSQYFNPGEELFTYSDLDELTRLLRELLTCDSEELCRVAEKGYSRVRREHTYGHRALTIIQATGLKPGREKGHVIRVGVDIKVSKPMGLRDRGGA